MTDVNQNAKETVDTLDYIIQWVLGIWDALPVELKAFALTVFAVSLLMEWVKRALLIDLPKRERVKKLWLASLPLGILLAGLGMTLAGKHVDIAYWVVIGLTSGTTAMGLHYTTLKVAVPFLTAVWGRFMLMVRGHA